MNDFNVDMTEKKVCEMSHTRNRTLYACKCACNVDNGGNNENVICIVKYAGG